MLILTLLTLPRVHLHHTTLREEYKCGRGFVSPAPVQLLQKSISLLTYYITHPNRRTIMANQSKVPSWLRDGRIGRVRERFEDHPDFRYTALRMPLWSGSIWWFVDTETNSHAFGGRIFAGASDFVNGFAAVKVKDHWTHIGGNGENMYEPRFADVGNADKDGWIKGQTRGGTWIAYNLHTGEERT